MNEETGRKKHDPVEETLRRLASRGHSDIPIEMVVAAWRNALYPELELRVGGRMSAGLTDNELRKFEALVDADDDAGVSKWLATHVPQYPLIVDEELNRLVGEAVEWLLHVSTALAEVAP